jgi:hopene-associated glycosyltransferase HpnB
MTTVGLTLTGTALLGLLVAAIWLYLAVARGGFWRGRENEREMHAHLARRGQGAWPKVVAVIPARNEAELVGETVGSLLSQRYPGDFSVVVVDDHSTDGTADVARAAAVAQGAADRFTVIGSPPLPKGWMGKLWALSQGAAYCDALDRAPDYVLFTDADIRYGPGSLAALVSFAIDNRRVLTSLMVALRCESFAERALIPAFVFFFQMLYPFAWVNGPERRTAAAAGGCVLLDRRTLVEAGGVASIRGALIDDCALAARIKPFGPIHLALGETVASLRAYPRYDDIRRMVVRSAFAQLRFSVWRLAFVVAAMLLVFVAPVALAIGATGSAQLLGVAAWIVMGLLYMPMLGRYRVPRLFAFALPAIAGAYLAFTVESALQHWSGRGGQWKGRVNSSAMATTGTDPTPEQ